MFRQFEIVFRVELQYFVKEKQFTNINSIVRKLKYDSQYVDVLSIFSY